MRKEKSLLGYGRKLGRFIALLLIACLATAAEGGQQSESLGEAKPVAAETAADLVSWSLSGQDFACLQDRQTCSVAAGQFASVQVTRESVDMRPCFSAASVSPAQANEQVDEVPACFFEFFADMQDVDYPAPELLWQALKARVSLVGRNNPQRKKIVEGIDQYVHAQINATVLQRLREELGILLQFESLNDRAFQSGGELVMELDRLYIALGERFEQYHSLVLAQARKVHRYDDVKTVQWVPSCKCAQRNLAGEVYGFMPFWLAGDKHVIDFGAQARLGYYAVGFNDQGSIIHEEGWRTLDSDFVGKLRGNGGKLDMVVYRNDWMTWSQLGRAERKHALSRLAEDIVRLIKIPRSDFHSRLKPYLTLGLSAAPVIGDGVTLYFEHYPQDGESVEAFSQFLDELGDKLRTDKRDFALNIMFRSEEIGKGIFDYQKLVERVERHTGQKQKILLLALLQEPTTNGKKQLRQVVENALHGEQRMKLLRHIVTVISFDGHNTDQLVDDIIYAKDNFGGIGFWMQRGAANNNEADTVVRSALHENYQQ